MKELSDFRKFLNENLDEISLRGLMGRDMTGAEIAADPKKFEILLDKIMSHIGDPSLEDRVRAWLKVELEEFADTDFSDPEEVKMTAKSAVYAIRENEEKESDIDMVLPRGKEIVLKAEDKDYERGLLVTLLEDGGYEVKYWFEDPSKVYPVEVFIDGESIKKDGKVVKLGFHPELEK